MESELAYKSSKVLIHLSYLRVAELDRHMHPQLSPYPPHPLLTLHTLSPSSPYLDGDTVLSERPCLDELVDAVDREVAGHVGTQLRGRWNTHCMCTHNLQCW